MRFVNYILITVFILAGMMQMSIPVSYADVITDNVTSLEQPPRDNMKLKEDNLAGIYKQIPVLNAFGETSYIELSVVGFTDGNIRAEFNNKSYEIKAPLLTHTTYEKDKAFSKKYGNTWVDVDDLEYNDKIRVEFRSNQPVNKFSVEFESSYESRLIGNTIWFGEFDEDGNPIDAVGFNWDDAIQTSNYDVVNKRLEFDVPIGKDFLIDPSVVATSTNYYAVGVGNNHRTFYYNSRHWVFYSDGTDFLYKTSTDGNSWSAAGTIKAGITNGFNASVYFDGTYVHYGLAAWSFGADVFYRRGVPESDGSITWSAVEQTAQAIGVGDRPRWSSIAIDTNGQALIAYEIYDGATYEWYVVRNSNNDGTWATDSNTLMTSETGHGMIVPMAAQKAMFLFCSIADGDFDYRIYNAGWGVLTSLITGTYHRYFSASSDGDDVYLAYYDITNTEVRFIEYTGAAWGAEQSVESASNPTSPSIADLGAGDLVVFWCETSNDHVYYEKYLSNVWQGSVDWQDESADLFASGEQGSSSFEELSGITAYLYTTKNASPYDINYAFLLGVTAPDGTNQAASQVTASSARLNGLVVDDGGEPCEVRFCWDTVSHSANCTDDDATGTYSCNCTAYANTSGWFGSYSSSDTPYYDIASLSCNTTYYYCFQVQNSDSGECGGELSFTTSDCALGCPQYFTGLSDEDSISLTWQKGTGVQISHLRVAQGTTCPTANTTGTLLYEGDLTYYTHSNLPTGRTYCYILWGYDDGNLTSCNATLTMTTLAVEGADEDIDTPVQPSRYWDDADYTHMDGFIFYGMVNGLADSFGFDRGMMWLMLVILIGIIVAIVTFWLTHGITFAVAGMTLIWVLGWIQHITPFYLILVAIVTMAMLIFIRHRSTG